MIDIKKVWLDIAIASIANGNRADVAIKDAGDVVRRYLDLYHPEEKKEERVAE